MKCNKSIEFLKDFFLTDPEDNTPAKIVHIEGSDIHPGKFAIYTQTKDQKLQHIATRHLIETSEFDITEKEAK